MSISQDFPDLTPSLNLNFAGSKKLDPRITFTRGSYSTYMDDNGLVKLATTNQPRFDHSFNGTSIESLGLLIEESRTNIATYSEQFDNAVWAESQVNVTITTNAITSPDGTNTADLVSNTGEVVSLIGTVLDGLPASSTTDYYATVYAKKGTASYFTFNCYYASNAEDNVSFNFDTGAVTGVPYSGEYIFQDVGNGWYRCGFRMTRDSVGTNTIIYFRFWQSGRGLTSGNTYFWGAQLEAGAFPTSYIPTGASQVTRSADNASITGTNFSNWYNPLEGSIFSSAIVNVPTTVSAQLNVFHLGFDNADGYGVFREFGTKRGWAHIRSGNTSLANFDSGQIWNQNAVFKSSISFKTEDQAISYNGQPPIVATVSTTSISNINRLNLGSANVESTFLNGTISQLSYYPKRLTNTQLQNLTK